MARYYFDTYDGAEYVRDVDGVELESDAHVAEVASRELGEMALDTLPYHGLHAFSVSVRNESDRPVFHGSLTLFSQWL